MVLICMAAGVTALRDTQADMQVSRQPFMLGCPLLLDAQTRIVVGCACMRGQMIFRAVQLKSGNIESNVQPLSRQTFRASERPGHFPLEARLWRKRGRDPPDTCSAVESGPLGTELSSHDGQTARADTLEVSS